MSGQRGRAVVAALCAVAVAVLPSGPANADQIRDDQWHLRYLHVAEAHRLSRGDGVIVAVIDTGVDPHPDLRRNLLSGIDTVPGASDDGREDLDGHGTGMAGLIAAHGQEASGALGIAPMAKILPIRYSTANGNADSDADAISKGIEWAVSHHADVISMSFTGGSDPQEVAALRAASKSNIVLVAGAGNRPAAAGIGFPAALDGVLAVGATDRRGNHAAVSVTGPQMALVAPGVDIYSTSTAGRYRRGTGTSDSTAIVAGAAALVRSRFPQLSAKEVVHRLTATAIDKGPPGRDDEYGYGELNLIGALTADVPPLEPSPDAGELAGPSPSPTEAVAAPVRRGGNGPLTAVLIGVAALLAVAVVVVLLLPRIRRHARPPGRP